MHRDDLEALVVSPVLGYPNEKGNVFSFFHTVHGICMSRTSFTELKDLLNYEESNFGLLRVVPSFLKVYFSKLNGK